jgi:hypothetical protein
MNAVVPPKPDATRLPNGAELIAANAYPAVMPKAEAAQFIANLKSEETGKRAERTIASTRNVMRDAVEGYVRALDEASRKHDANAMFAQAHEIRGLAEMAGLGVAGRMANGLCLYFDALDGKALDKDTVRLHVEAIQRVVSGEDEGAIADVVAEELTSLVIRKLGESRALGLPG